MSTDINVTDLEKYAIQFWEDVKKFRRDHREKVSRNEYLKKNGVKNEEELQMKRIKQKIKVTDDGCWEYQSSTQNQGYCQVSVKGKRVLAHRLMWELTNGEIPPEMCMDHLCKNRKCINPEHLRIVTRGQNILENSNSIQAVNKRKTHCVHGHTLEDAIIYTYIKNGKEYKTRHCRTCKDLKKSKKKVA